MQRICLSSFLFFFPPRARSLSLCLLTEKSASKAALWRVRYRDPLQVKRFLRTRPRRGGTRLCGGLSVIRRGTEEKRRGQGQLFAQPDKPGCVAVAVLTRGGDVFHAPPARTQQVSGAKGRGNRLPVVVVQELSAVSVSQASSLQLAKHAYGQEVVDSPVGCHAEAGTACTDSPRC